MFLILTLRVQRLMVMLQLTYQVSEAYIAELGHQINRRKLTMQQKTQMDHTPALKSKQPLHKKKIIKNG